MPRTFIYPITQASDGMKIRSFLKKLGYSRQNMIELKKIHGSVTVDGCFRRFNMPVYAGETLQIVLHEMETSDVLPVRLPVGIVYEDEDLLVVDKPAGMPTHPSFRNRSNTLANALAWYFQEKGEPFVFRCSNRLDRDTSGLTIVSKHIISANILSEMGVRHEIQREYLALVRGSLPVREGTIRAPLGRKNGSLIERTVDFENGENAVTHYRVVEEKNGYSLVSLLLETGRTHQIRIHMKYLGFPLAGDTLYGQEEKVISSAGQAPGSGKTNTISRQALHAHRLTFRHPITGREMSFSSPLPADLAALLS